MFNEQSVQNSFYKFFLFIEINHEICFLFFYTFIPQSMTTSAITTNTTSGTTGATDTAETRLETTETRNGCMFLGVAVDWVEVDLDLGSVVVICNTSTRVSG